MAWFRTSVNRWAPLVGTIILVQNVKGLTAGLIFLLWSVFSLRVYLWHKVSICLLVPGISISVIDEFYSVSTQRSSGKYKEEISSNFILLVNVTLNSQYNLHELHIEIKNNFFSPLYEALSLRHTEPIKRFYSDPSILSLCVLTNARVPHQDTGVNILHLHGFTQSFTAENVLILQSHPFKFSIINDETWIPLPTSHSLFQIIPFKW